MLKRPVLVLLVVTLLGALIYGFTQGFELGQNSSESTPTPIPTTTSTTVTSRTPTQETSPTQAITPQKQKVKVYLVAIDDAGKSGEAIGCGDSLIPVTREVAKTQGVLKASLMELFSLHDQYYGQSGLYNSLYNSHLQVDSANVANGNATVNLSGELSLGGVCDDPRVEGQIRSTAEQFETVKKVDIFLNGVPLSEALSEK